MPTSDQARRLLNQARGARPFRSEHGQPCVSVGKSVGNTAGAQTIFPIRSAGFRDWLTNNFFNETESAPSDGALRATVRTLEAQARYTEFPVRKVNHRVAYDGDPLLPTRIAIDLANSSGEILEITSRGWTVGENLRYAFRESSSTQALPRPESREDSGAGQTAPPLAELRALLRLENSETWHRVLAWLTAALRPAGPYPILVLSGPTGSGKSFLARALRSLIDPSAAPAHRIPTRDDEVLQLAYHNWILAFDQVHRIPAKIADALCAISSGDAFEIAQPDQRDPIVFQIARPMILIAPHDETQPAWTPPRTLASRTLAIQLEHIGRPRPESLLWSAFESVRPSAIGSLADAVSTALRRIRDIDLAVAPRFPDCVYWTAAAAPALGIDEAAIVDAYAQPNSVWTGSDPLREAIHALLEPTGTWTGEAADLLNQLRECVPLAALPSTPRSLSQALPSIIGVRVAQSKLPDGRRALALTRVDDASQKMATPIV